MTEDKKFRFKVGAGTGFVPCTKHARMIAAGKMKLEDLIENRISIKPFPKG